MLLKEMMDAERNEGKTEGRSEAILVLLGVLGEVPDRMKTRVLEMKDEQVLDNWLILARKASSVKEFADACGICFKETL